MNVTSKMPAGLRAGWRWLAVPEPWSRRPQPPAGRPRGMGIELALALVLGLTAGLLELLVGGGLRVYVMVLAAGVLSLLRRRLPVPALVAACALAGYSGALMPVLLLVGWSAGRRITGPVRALAAFGAGCAVYCAVMVLTTWPGGGLTIAKGMWVALSFLALAVVPGLISRYWSQRRTLLHALQERNAQLLWERRMIAGRTRLMERQRIAQDMHDSLGHQLALIAVHTGALEVDPELTVRQREAVSVLRNASVSAMHELREVVGILRDGVEADPAPVDESGRAARGTAGIPGLVAAARAAGNTVGLRHTGEERPLAAAADHAAYRIVQEALTNAYKHAPGAPIGVELRYEPDSLVVEIVSGPAVSGTDAVSGGQGLTGLRERARLVGGMVHAGAADGGGFRVAGVLPYGVVEAAPFVAGEDDFPRQTGPAVYDDGVPVMDWSVAGREKTMEELGGLMALAGGDGNPAGRKRRNGFRLGCGIAVGAFLLLVAGVVVGLFLLFESFTEGMIDRSDYDAVTVGEAESEVRDRLPSGDTIATSGLRDKGPKPPAGSNCLVLMSSEFGEGQDSEPVFRFCFADGKLVEKKAYEVVR
ncbi:histidine kinase [Streptomyces sp. CAU 1734]|uniref:sensor histidine kinase n=1 Tax=Streptomyces sp. CAU 1734 TaxID=3140360 RepID=UPI0032614DDF